MMTGARRAPAGIGEDSFLFGAKEARTYAGSQGIPQRLPFRCNKTKTTGSAERRSSPSPPLRLDEKLCMRRPPLVRIGCTPVPFQIGRCGIPSLLSHEGRGPGHYKY